MAEPCFIERASNSEIDKGITPEFASKFWRHAKANYSEKGINFHEAIPKLSAEFKIPERVVSRILNANKSVRVVAEDLAKVQRTNRKFLSDNRRYIANSSKSDAAKLLTLVHDGIRGGLLALHGPVIGGIHPIDQLFTPGRIKGFLRAYGRSVKAASPAQVDLMMSKLAEQPRYQEWIDAGLPLSRREPLEGFHVGGWGGGAMEAGLKPLMYEYAEHLYSKLPPELKNKVMMQDIAQQASFATGAIPKGFLGHGRIAQAFTQLQLARSLNVARWMKSFIDPAKTINTYVQTGVGKASHALPERFHRPIPEPEARRAASHRLWAAGKWFGGITGSLIFNDQFNRAIGSRSRVNFTDPTRPDYMAFKINIPGLGEYYIKTRGSMEVLQLLARAASTASPYQRQKFGQQTPEETLGRYTEYKATPSLSLGKEILTGRDVFGRPVPWSKERGTAKHPQYYTEEWVGLHLPIFLGHGVQSFYEGMRENGINPRDVHGIFRGIQRHPEILARAGFETASEFFGFNPQRVRGKPYQVPPTQRKFERNYLGGS